MVHNLFEEVKEIIKEKIKEFYIRFKYLALLIIFIILILGIFKCTQENPKEIESQQLMIFGITIDNWAQWITIITLPYTAGWAILQYYKNSLLRKQEKAAEIAKLFSDELLDKCSLIGDVIEHSNMKEILRLKEIDMSNLKSFDRTEIIKIYNDENIFKKYKKVLISKNLQLTYLYLLEKRISNKSFKEIKYKNIKEKERLVIEFLKDKYSKDEINKLKKRNMLFEEFEKYCINNNKKSKIDEIYRREYTDKEARELFILDNKNLPFLFLKLISDVLNELEYICMYISSQSAGSYFVYQSLHQIFLRTIKSAALSIAYVNRNYSDKYYTNIIHVYKKWYNKREIDIRKEEKNSKKAYKYLEPKIKTV